MRMAIAGVMGLAVGLGVAPDVAGQSRVVAPIVVPRPAPAAGGATGTHVQIHGGPTVSGRAAAPGVRGGGASVPTNSQEVRIVTPGRPETRVIIQEPSVAGRTGGPGAGGGGAASVSRFGRELRVIVEEDAGPGVPPVRRETQIFIQRPDVETPIIIVPE